MEPTEEGKRRYPPDGYYTVMVTPGTPGTRVHVHVDVQRVLHGRVRLRGVPRSPQ